MPRVPLDFLTKPIGYTFPIVTAALDELKPPAEIRKIRLAAQRGPLLVTLAAQLAAIVADAIYQQLAKPEVRHPFPELLALHGGKSYMALLQKVETASDHLNDAHRRVNQLEIRLVFHDWAVFESQRWATGKRTPSPLSGVLTWNPQPGDKGASTAKREYEKTTWDYLACRKKASGPPRRGGGGTKTNSKSAPLRSGAREDGEKTWHELSLPRQKEIRQTLN